jgi:hypothetical protein
VPPLICSLPNLHTGNPVGYSLFLSSKPIFVGCGRVHCGNSKMDLTAFSRPSNRVVVLDRSSMVKPRIPKVQPHRQSHPSQPDVCGIRFSKAIGAVISKSSQVKGMVQPSINKATRQLMPVSVDGVRHASARPDSRPFPSTCHSLCRQ